jgi:hypothetical protein
MKPWVKLLIAALVLALCVGGYVVLSKMNSDSAKKSAETEQTEQLIGTLEGDVAKIKYTYGGKTYRFTLSEDKWTNADDANMPIDNDTVAAVATSLKNGAEVVRVVDESGQYKTSFGLDNPVLTVIAGDGSAEVKYQVGDKNASLGGYYAKLNDSDTVYIIDSTIPESLMKDIYDFVEADSFPSVLSDNVRGINLTSGGKTLELTYFAEGRSNIYTKNYTWFLFKDGGYTPARSSAVTVLAGDIVGITADKCVNYKPSSSELEAYGLTNPETTVMLSYVVIDGTDASEESAVVTIKIGAETGAGGARYLTWSDTEMVFTVDEDTVNDILAYLDEDFEPNEVCAMTVDEVKSAEMTANGVTVNLIHTKQTSTNSDGGTTTTDVYTVDGNVVENSKAEAVFTSLNKLKIDSVADKGNAEGTPYLTITLHSDREGFETLTLKAYAYNTNFYRVSFNGRNNMLVSLRDIENLAGKISALAQ